MFFKEIKNFLTKENKVFIEEVILSNNFPYFLDQTPSVIKDKKDSVLTHVVLRRPEERPPNQIYNSHFHPDITAILESALKKLKIKRKKFLRIAINLTYNNGAKTCHIHKDHEYDHNQIIIYLNDVLDKDSKTIILDEKDKILKEIKPEKYKAVCFNNYKHYHYYPKIGNRVVLVATFI